MTKIKMNDLSSDEIMALNMDFFWKICVKCENYKKCRLDKIKHINPPIECDKIIEKEPNMEKKGDIIYIDI